MSEYCELELINILDNMKIEIAKSINLESKTPAPDEMSIISVDNSLINLHSKPKQTSTKYLEAKFRGGFIQVQQVKLVNKKLEDQPVVFIDTHNKLQKV